MYMNTSLSNPLQFILFSSQEALEGPRPDKPSQPRTPRAFVLPRIQGTFPCPHPPDLLFPLSWPVIPKYIYRYFVATTKTY